MRYLGIDFGTKRIGLALSDESGSMAFPHSTVVPADAVHIVTELVQKEGVGTVVLGESLDFQNRDNPIMSKVERFKEELESAGLSVVYEPEGMTSAQAARNPEGESRRSASGRVEIGKKNNLDASAAALLLQAYLDKRQNI